VDERLAEVRMVVEGKTWGVIEVKRYLGLSKAIENVC
jgi:hypothetical protein